jgi:hypothetical protein
MKIMFLADLLVNFFAVLPLAIAAVIASYVREYFERRKQSKERQRLEEHAAQGYPDLRKKKN